MIALRRCLWLDKSHTTVQKYAGTLEMEEESMFRSSREGPTEEKTGRRMPIRLGTALIAATGLLLGPLALATSASAATLPHATTPVTGSYVPVTPFRITDTRGLAPTCRTQVRLSPLPPPR